MSKGKSFWKRAVFQAVEAFSIVSEPLSLAPKMVKNQTFTYYIQKHRNFNASLPFFFFSHNTLKGWL